MLPLPAPVQSGEAEGSPSLSDDGRLLAFSSNRIPVNGDDIYLADLSALQSTGTVSLLATPGLPTGSEQTHPWMSGNGSLIGFETGRVVLRERDVQLYSRTENRLINSPVLSAGLDTYDPAPAPNGSSLLLAKRIKDLGDTEIYRFSLGSGSLVRLGALRSDLGDEHPSIAEPVELFDRTPPKVKLRCKAIGGREVALHDPHQRAREGAGDPEARRHRQEDGAPQARPQQALHLRAKATGRGKLRAAVSDPSEQHHRLRGRGQIS